jgi:hypothetical protein
MADPHLFGSVFASPSFWTWRTLAKLIDGAPLTEPREIELARQCTGRTQLPTSPVRRLVLLAGRRAGKDRFLSSCAIWRAALAVDWRKYQSPGEGSVCLLIGADKRQASILRRYCHGLLQAPLLAREVVRQTDLVTEFRNGASLEIGTNDARLIRGRSAIALLGSECAHWKTSEFASSNDEEVVSAAEPSMAMCPDGGLVLLGSSVYRKAGYMYRKFTELHGNDLAGDDICWFANSVTMNARLSPAIIERAVFEGGARARAEFENRWREDSADFLPADVVHSATDFGVHEREPMPSIRYIAAVDSAGGTGSDSFALAIAHRDHTGMAILDVIRSRKPRFVPAQVIAEYVDLLRLYSCQEIYSDSFAGGFHSSEWQRHNIRFIASERTTSENFLAVGPILLANRCRLVDNAALRNELTSLERRVSAGDREYVGHPQHASAHDDLAAACALAVVQVTLCKRSFAQLSPEAINAALAFSRIPQRGTLESGSLWRSLGRRAPTVVSSHARPGGIS